jgi:rod shape-determining protein MreD
MWGNFCVCLLLARLQLYGGSTWFGLYSPYYLLSALVFIAHQYPKQKNYWSFFCLGLFIDTFSLCPFGFHATLYLFLGSLLNTIKELLYYEKRVFVYEVVLMQTVFCGLWTFFLEGGSRFLLFFTDTPAPSFSWSILGGRLFFTLLVSFPLLVLFHHSLTWFTPSKKTKF